jgi:hypothetical protein
VNARAWWDYMLHYGVRRTVLYWRLKRKYGWMTPGGQVGRLAAVLPPVKDAGQ